RDRKTLAQSLGGSLGGISGTLAKNYAEMKEKEQLKKQEAEYKQQLEAQKFQQQQLAKQQEEQESRKRQSFASALSEGKPITPEMMGGMQQQQGVQPIGQPGGFQEGEQQPPSMEEALKRARSMNIDEKTMKAIKEELKFEQDYKAKQRKEQRDVEADERKILNKNVDTLRKDAEDAESSIDRRKLLSEVSGNISNDLWGNVASMIGLGDKDKEDKIKVVNALLEGSPDEVKKKLSLIAPIKLATSKGVDTINKLESLEKQKKVIRQANMRELKKQYGELPLDAMNMSYDMSRETIDAINQQQIEAIRELNNQGQQQQDNEFYNPEEEFNIDQQQQQEPPAGQQEQTPQWLQQQEPYIEQQEQTPQFPQQKEEVKKPNSEIKPKKDEHYLDKVYREKQKEKPADTEPKSKKEYKAETYAEQVKRLGSTALIKGGASALGVPRSMVDFGKIVKNVVGVEAGDEIFSAMQKSLPSSKEMLKIMEGKVKRGYLAPRNEYEKLLYDGSELLGSLAMPGGITKKSAQVAGASTLTPFFAKKLGFGEGVQDFVRVGTMVYTALRKPELAEKEAVSLYEQADKFMPKNKIIDASSVEKNIFKMANQIEKVKEISKPLQ
ncbi:MAG TPA: hypothetical protein V6C96_02695, partial [Vampirovibrionales bacterium]